MIIILIPIPPSAVELFALCLPCINKIRLQTQIDGSGYAYEADYEMAFSASRSGTIPANDCDEEWPPILSHHHFFFEFLLRRVYHQALVIIIPCSCQVLHPQCQRQSKKWIWGESQYRFSLRLLFLFVLVALLCLLLLLATVLMVSRTWKRTPLTIEAPLFRPLCSPSCHKNEEKEED